MPQTKKKKGGIDKLNEDYNKELKGLQKRFDRRYDKEQFESFPFNPERGREKGMPGSNPTIQTASLKQKKIKKR